MSTFTYIPDRNFRRTTEPRVLEAQFGDGYSQRTSDLLNNVNESFALTFNNRTNTDIENIIAFFEITGGYDSFDWTPPGESTSIKVIVDKWNKTYITNDYSSLSATFTRVYA